jgi:signal transduction histidine kinase
MTRAHDIAVECAPGDESVVDGQPAEIVSAHLSDQELRHELRNALTPAIGYATWLRQRSAQWTDEWDRRALEVVYSSLRLAGRLVQEERTAASRDQCDLRRLAAVAVSQVPPLRLGDVVIKILTEDPLVGHWDPDRVVRVLMNLLGNAVKYSPDGTPIVVEIGRHADRARIVVRDKGIGIDANDLDAIFEGHRTDLARLVSSGSGIGLSLSRRLIEAEGGELGVSSWPGSGSEFWVELPFNLSPAPAARPKLVTRQEGLSPFANVDTWRELDIWRELDTWRDEVTAVLHPASREIVGDDGRRDG